MSAQQPKSTLDGMPKQFVSSLKVLFDILDEEKSGLVRLADIESRWKDGEVSGLPNGVVDALKKVTPASGKLTFERFVAGLKIALLRNKGDSLKDSTQSAVSLGGLGLKPDLLNHDAALNNNNKIKPDPAPKPLHKRAPNIPDFAASLPLPATKNFPRSATHRPTTAAVRPNNAVVNQRSTSTSGLSPPDSRCQSTNHDITPPLPPSAPPSTTVSALRNDPFLQDPLPVQNGPRTEPRRGGPALWQPTQSQYNDPYNNRAINGVGANNYDRYDNSNTDPYGRNKDDIVFALRKLQQNRTQGNGETGNRLTDDQRLQALGRAPGEGRASIALASFDSYGELLCLLHVQSFQLLLGNYVIHIENYILRISNYFEQ